MASTSIGPARPQRGRVARGCRSGTAGKLHRLAGRPLGPGFGQRKVVQPLGPLDVEHRGDGAARGGVGQEDPRRSLLRPAFQWLRISNGRKPAAAARASDARTAGSRSWLMSADHASVRSQRRQRRVEGAVPAIGSSSLPAISAHRAPGTAAMPGGYQRWGHQAEYDLRHALRRGRRSGSGRTARPAPRLGYVRGRLLGAQGDTAGAEEAFALAHASLAPLPLPYEKVRVDFAHGLTLRRLGRRHDAAERLHHRPRRVRRARPPGVRGTVRSRAQDRQPSAPRHRGRHPHRAGKHRRRAGRHGQEHAG